MEFEKPENYHDTISKFVRVGKKLSVTAPGDLNTVHEDLAIQDGILNELNSIKNRNPQEVDGGFFHVYNDLILLSGNSSSLNLPNRRYAKEARETTVKVFKEKSPDGYTIVNNF